MEKNGMKCILFIHEHNCNDISYFEYVNIKPNNSYSFKRMCLYSSFIRETNKKIICYYKFIPIQFILSKTNVVFFTFYINKYWSFCFSLYAL